MKSIALFGGSFNPPHPGHFQMASHIYKSLGVDEVWFLFSQNPFKDASKYASVAQRIEMCRILSEYFPDLPFIACDIEESVGSHRTYDILCALKEKYPDNKFIWAMGADNLREFHTWGNSQDIIEANPIVVTNRGDHGKAAKESVTALKYEFLKVADPQRLKTLDQGWSFLEVETADLSSSSLLASIHEGQRNFPGPFQHVADYIFRNGLYNTQSTPSAGLNATPN